MILGLAPMDGITNCAYRIVVKRIFDAYKKKKPDFDHELWMWTEFMSAEWYIRNPQRLITHLIHTDFDTPTIAQIYGGELDALVQTAQDIEKKYPQFAGVELNIGCPSPKVMSCGGGAGMMKDKKKTLEMVKTLSQSIKKPFSFKTRIGLTLEDQKEQFDFIVEASQWCHMIAIHGRTYKQSHHGEVQWDFVYRIKKELWEKCKVVWNGGIKSYEDALQAQWNLDGIMIGQAAIGNPWVFFPEAPSLQERYELSIFHLKLLLVLEKYYKQHQQFDDIFPMSFYQKMLQQVEQFDESEVYDNRRVIEYRKYLFNYVVGLVWNKEFKQRVAQISDYQTLKLCIDEYFRNLINDLYM